MAIDKIDNLDKKILCILSKNARIPFKDVAAECNVSRAAIHQRVQHLIEAGIITGSGFDINPIGHIDWFIFRDWLLCEGQVGVW